MTHKQIKTFRTIFATAVAVLELGNTIAEIHGGKPLEGRASQVLALHKQGLAECEKKEPSGEVVLNVLKQLEELAEQRLPSFPQGGISEGWVNNDFVQGGKFEPNDLAHGARVISREENENL